MSGASFLLDTNVVLYLLSGNKTIADTIDGAQIYVSFVTELELSVHAVLCSVCSTTTY